MSYGYFDDDYFEHNRCSGRKQSKPMGPDAPHYPNKAERRELTRIAQKSGMTEAEIRQDPVHRRALAKARSEPVKCGETNRYELKAKRRAREEARRLGCEVWQLTGIHATWRALKF